MSICLRRREFITVLGGAAVWPLAAGAQQPTMPVIGYLSLAPGPPNYGLYDPPFLEGLAQAGYVFGRNLATQMPVTALIIMTMVVVLPPPRRPAVTKNTGR